MKQGYKPREQRKKILLICDDIRVYSGIATVAREIVINTAGTFNWVNVGGSITHPEKGKRLDLSQSTNEVSGINDASVMLYPVDGYGDPDLIRQLIKLENPDAIMLITDPRYFVWLFQIENEIRRKIPIAYLNIWDEWPAPIYNLPYYESCDLLMGISKQTVAINKTVLGDKAKNRIIEYVPHGLNEKIFKPITPEAEDYPQFLEFKKNLFKGKEYDFALFFNSRNIRRKSIPDALLAYKFFIDSLTEEQASKCVFVLHTELVSEHGTDLEAVCDLFLDDDKYNIIIDDIKYDPVKMNYLYNCTDCQVQLTSNEGWGLSLTEAILVGNPIIANVQGGMQDQMRFEKDGKWVDLDSEFPSNHNGTIRKHGEWAFPVYPTNKSLQGSPQTPYIWDTRCTPEDAAEQMKIVYNLPKETRKAFGLKGREWAISEEAGLTGEKMGERIVNCFDKLFLTWKPRESYEIVDVNKVPNRKAQHSLQY